VDRQQIGLLGLSEKVTGDLVAWGLMLLGVVLGLGALRTRLGGPSNLLVPNQLLTPQWQTWPWAAAPR
jgi:hypothetical protein